MIQVEHLTKRFGRATAVDDASFHVRRREIVGILGPNGAGKTTTMQILACYLPATGGRVLVSGLDVFRESLEVRQRIGYLPESAALYPDMRVKDYVRYRGRLKGLSGRRLRDRVKEVLQTCGLADVRRQVIGQLSRGFRQRVCLADALVHEPELLILDEPTVGLDPNQIRHMRQLIRSLGQHHTVLLASHILPEVEMICDRVLIMNAGRIVASDTPENLVGLLKGNPRVTLEVKGAPREAVEEKLRVTPGVTRVVWEQAGDAQRFTCEGEKGTDVREALYWTVSRNGWALRELTTEKRHLEDVFVAVTSEEG
jgi:ABC-2 type transport system ATP-binding protein